jgi:glycosyltransferase-like protein
MLSVGVFTHSTQPRGSVVHAVGLAEALAAAGHDATLYTLGKPGASLYRTTACRVELLPAAAAPSADSDALVRQRIGEFVSGVRRVPRRHDVYHAQDCLAASALLSLRPDGVGPVVRTVHHVEHFDSPYLAECQRRSICDADGVLSVSLVTQANVLAQFGRASLLVHNGVDGDRFATRRPEVEERLRHRYGIEPGDTVILSVGGVEPRKNTLLALGAVAAAHARVPRVRWIVVGDHSVWDHSGYVARFEQERGRLGPGLAGRIVRAGTLPEDELTSLYALSDVLLCPSREEGFGLCVLEAMAAGVAVVVPGRAPFTEYLDDTCAALIDSGSVASVAEALAALATDSDRRRAIAEAARRRSRRFTWSRSADLHTSHYRVVRSRSERAYDAVHERSSHA